MAAKYVYVAYMLVSIIITVNAGCPSRKTASKMQLARITKSLGEDDIILEAQFVNNIESKPTNSRFIVEHVWQKNNGGLQLNELIEVEANDPSFDTCYQQLVPEKSYFLVLKKSHDSNTFTAVEPPVSSRRRKVKDAAWKALCDTSAGNCALRVAMPKTSIVYQGSIIVLECQIKSKSKIVSVEWLKDGASVDTPTHRSLGIDVIAPNREGSAIMIVQANHIHNGRYKCVATNSDHQTGEGTTVVTIFGPQATNNYRQCKEQTYCLNGGTCHTFLDEALDKFCMCPPGFEGARCEANDEDITNIMGVESYKNQTLLFQLSQMTIAIVVLATLLVGLLVVGGLYTNKLRKMSSKTNTPTDFYEGQTILKHVQKVETGDSLEKRDHSGSDVISPVISLLSNEGERLSLPRTSSPTSRSSASSTKTSPKSNSLERKRNEFAKHHKLSTSSRSRLNADS